jgi:hypothetical protein
MIVAEIFYFGINKFFDKINEDIAGEKNVEERLRMFVDRALETIHENGDFFKTYVGFLTKEAENPRVQEMVTTFYDKYIETLSGIIKEGIAAKIFRPVEAEKLARAIYCLSIGVLFARFVMKVDFDVNDQNHFQINSILESIRK